MRTKTATSGLDFTNDPTYGWLASAYGPVFNSKGEAVLAVRGRIVIWIRLLPELLLVRLEL